MPTLQQIHEYNAQFVRNSGYSVKIDSRFGWVEINHESGDDTQSFFLQGSDAEQYIGEYETITDQCPDLTFEDAAYSLAKQYIDCL